MFTNCFITPSVTVFSRHVGLVKPTLYHSISVLDKVFYNIAFVNSER